MNILFICNTDGAMFNFRGPLIRKHVSEGDRVFCLCQVDNYRDELLNLGVVEVLHFEFGLRISQLFTFRRNLKNWISYFNITHLHVYTITCILYFLTVSKRTSLSRSVCTLTGLGRLFGPRSTILSRGIVLILLGLILRIFDTIFFQNEDDYQYFSRKLGFLKEKYKLVYGSGIDISHIHFSKQISDDFISKLKSHKSFTYLCLMSSRLVLEKGYLDFYACAELLKFTHPEIIFVHIGPLEREVSSRGILGPTENLVVLPYSKHYYSLLSLADVFVLPSYYKEGVPRSLIEAVLFNKRIVTTDFSGCKHAVVEGLNGLLVPPKSPKKLAAAILSSLSLDYEQLTKANHRLVREKFDVNIHFEKNRQAYD